MKVLNSCNNNKNTEWGASRVPGGIPLVGFWRRVHEFSGNVTTAYRRVKFSVVDGLMIAPFGMAFLISVINKRKSKETIFAFLGVIIGYLSVFSTDCDSYVYPILAISILLISCITNKVGKKIKINNICIICVIEFLIIKSIFGSQGLSVNIAFALIESLSIIPVWHRIVIMSGVNI